MRSLGLRALGLALVLAAASACSSSTPSTIAPAAGTISQTLTGVVPAAVNGVQQTSFVSFTVGTVGTTTVALTSAVETLPGGEVNATVTVCLGVGSLDSTGTICTLLAGTVPTLVQAGPTTYGPVQL